MSKDLTYVEAVEQVMLHNGYIAPLKLIYKEIWRYKDKGQVKGKTPLDTIREKVQRDKKFTRVGLGVYALSDKLHLLKQQETPKTPQEKLATKHAQIQGMLLEIGNSRNEVSDTYTNDKNFIFENKNLGSICTLKSVPPFTYERIIKDSVSFMDVIWFNERMFPSMVFEVENSTDFRGALIKFTELIDFQTKFSCVAPIERKPKFDKEIQKNAFKSIRSRVRFYSYEQVEADYKRSLEKFNILDF